MNYTSKNPKPIRTEFVRDGMTHRQIKRTGNVAMFEIGRNGGVEVVLIRVAKPQKLPDGEMAPWRESYPSTGEFGTRGWYYVRDQRHTAERKFDERVAAERNSTPKQES
jgi:hypothetical protein